MERMFYLLGGNAPRGRVNFQKEENGTLIEYMATRTKEIMHIFKDSKCVASFYRTLSVAKKTDTEDTAATGEILKVAGDVWEEYKHYMGVDVDTPTEGTPETFGFQPSLTSKSLTLRKDLKYIVELNSSSKIMNDIGNSIEDYLYELREIREIAEENNLDLSWAERKNYRVLITDQEVHDFIQGLANTTEIVGFDTETTGLLATHRKLDILVGLSLSYEDDTGVYIPVAHKRMSNVEMGCDALLELLKPYIDRHSPQKKDLVTHNGGFDWRVLYMHGIDLNIVYDTYIRQCLLAINEAKYIRGLKAMAKKMLGYDVVELDEMYKTRSAQEVRACRVAVERGMYVNDITRYKLERAEKFEDVQYDFRFVSQSFAELYGSADADFPRLIHKLQDEIWDKSLDFIYRLEINLIPVLGEQEYFGVRGIQSEFEQLLVATQQRVAELEKQIYALVGYEFNISSGPQKAKVFFEDMGCPILPRFKTKKGGLKTDAETLKTLAGYKYEDGTPKYPVIPLVAEYTKLTTLIKNFYGKLPKLLHEGFIFPSYNQMGTETGRISCSKPNLQQTEPTSRNYMVPDSDEYYFLICDYSQVEYRIMAGMSGEKKVVDFFGNNPEADYHILAYANMMGKAYEDVTSKERKIGKVLNFGTTYGLEDEALALSLFGATTEYHQRMAAQKRQQYFDGVPVLRDYFERIRDEAQKKGFVRTLFGRKRAIDEFNYKGYIPEYKIQSGRRKAGNMPVQGTAADIMKMAMIRVQRAIRKYGFTPEQIRLVMNIHDELVIQVHKSINMWYALMIVRKAMEMDMSQYGFPPLYIGANVGYSWRDGKKDELEAPVLLMDEKIAEIEQKLANGETLETYDMPREVWADEISYFALRQVEKEIRENNYTSMAECYKNIRIMKYARHFETKRTVDGKEKSISFDNNVITLFLDRQNTAESVWAQFPQLLEEMPIVTYTPQATSSVGQELPQTEEGILQLLRQHIHYNREEKVLYLKLNEVDNEFLTLVDKMMITRDQQWYYRSDQLLTQVQISIADGFSHKNPFRYLLSGCMPLIKELMTIHLFGGNYLKLQDKPIEVLNSLINEDNASSY